MPEQMDWQGTPAYTMQNDKLKVSLCPAIGNNLYQIWDQITHRDILRVPASPQQLLEKPVHFGTPVLMPPSRIRHGRFQFQGREYQFDCNASGHHCHGFLKALPWVVTETTENAELCSITSSLSTIDFPELLNQYPHDLLFEMTYVLKGSSLIQQLKVTNRGKEAAPFGFGLHGWFMIDGEPEKWSLQLPVDGLWELGEDIITTGRIIPLGELAGLASSTGLPLKGLNLDTVFQIGDNPRQAVLYKEGYALKYSMSEAYKHWVLYTGGAADQWICLEPYTWVTDAPNLPLDASVTGLLAIEPNETLQLEVTLEIEIN